MAYQDSDENLLNNDISATDLSLIANNSDQNYILVNSEFKIIAFNNRVKNQYLKYIGGILKLGISILDLSPINDRASLEQTLKRVSEGNEEESVVKIQTPGYPDKYVLSRFKQAFDNAGQLRGILISSTDISSVKRVEAEKNELEVISDFEKENLKALINNSKSQIWSFDREFKLITFNQTFENKIKSQFNLQPKIGDNFILYYIDTDKMNKFKLYSKRVFNGEHYSMIEHSYEDKESWTEIAFNPIWKQQEVVGVACTASDVTERKLFEKSLIQSQNRLKQAQEIAHVGNWDLNFKTKSARWSDEAYKIYGITPNNFDHTFDSWLSFIHPEDFDDVKAIIDHGAKTLTDYSMYHRIIRPDGSIRYLYSETHFEFDNNGAPIGVHGISQDITDRRTNEIKLQELLKRSNDQNRWLNNFTNIVSHNIRSQNSNISGIVNLLNRDSSNFDQLMHMLKDSTGKLHETISNLSEYIKLQTNPEKQYKTVNLHDEINKTCLGINQLINESGATVINDTGKKMSLQLIPSFIESILLNLLTNAVKYRSSKRSLVIRLSNEAVNSFQCLTIEDNGVGIDLNKHKDAIFGIYQTFHGNNDALGFGLFITKNQIEAMDGKIEIDSTPDVGTKFKIYFHEKS